MPHSPVPPKRFFIEFSYKGTAYHGWQIQPNANSVQAELEKALSIAFRKSVSVTGAGRTDTGVHAKQMFAHFDLELNEEQLQPAAIQKNAYSVNMLLPYDIAAKRIIALHSDAHARFDATKRSYEYHIHFSKNPFLKDASWFVHPHRPDIRAMNEAAQLLFQYEDFSCFSKSNTQTFTNNCTITQAEWKETEDGIVFHISANRFLRNMVRAIVGTLMEVGQGKMNKENFRSIIESGNRSDAGQSVPACGLYLTRVEYPYIDVLMK